MAHSRASFFKLQELHHGQWPSLDRLLLELPEKRADRALLEMAYLARAIDDAEAISERVIGDLGVLYKGADETSALNLREVCNKIIHAARYEWQLGDPDNPTVICFGEDQEKWTKAEIKLNGLASAFGQLQI